jgi:hypothetical protein
MHMQGADIDIAGRQIWVRAFYGFDPENAGYIGFTKEGQRERMMSRMRDGDLVLIYGAVEELTEQDLRAQALGFLEVEMAPCRDRDRMSDEAFQLKVDHGFEDRWNFGIMVRRAWRVRNRVGIGTIAPLAYDQRNRFSRTTMAILLEEDERERAISHPVYQVNVFGEPEIQEFELQRGSLDSVLRPSKGIPPTFGDRSSRYEDGENLVYLMVLTAGANSLLPKEAAGFGHALVKVGRTNDTTRRLSEINCGFPQRANVRWRLEQHRKFPSAADAHAAEDGIKQLFAAKFTSQGNEFFSGDRAQLIKAFQSCCSTGGPRILGAAAKAKGI